MIIPNVKFIIILIHYSVDYSKKKVTTEKEDNSDILANRKEVAS